jgi:hypothetical protein
MVTVVLMAIVQIVVVSVVIVTVITVASILVPSRSTLTQCMLQVWGVNCVKVHQLVRCLDDCALRKYPIISFVYLDSCNKHLLSPSFISCINHVTNFEAVKRNYTGAYSQPAFNLTA